MDPHHRFDFDFMVHGTVGYFCADQARLVLWQLAQGEKIAKIPSHVGMMRPGLALTVQDVLDFKNGNFHISVPNCPVRMDTTGNLIPSEVVDDYFELLPTLGSLHAMRLHIREEYRLTVDDQDLLDLGDGAFHIIGPDTVSYDTKTGSFVPMRDSSEALWMLDRGCPAFFISRYLKYRRGTDFPGWEIEELSKKTPREGFTAQSWKLSQKPQSYPFFRAFLRSRLPPTCLKRTVRRAPPPLPIFTFPHRPSRMAKAERVSGATFTANPHVLRHNTDGKYETDGQVLPPPKARAKAIRNPWPGEDQYIFLSPEELDSTNSPGDEIHDLASGPLLTPATQLRQALDNDTPALFSVMDKQERGEIGRTGEADLVYQYPAPTDVEIQSLAAVLFDQADTQDTYLADEDVEGTGLKMGDLVSSLRAVTIESLEGDSNVEIGEAAAQTSQSRETKSFFLWGWWKRGQ